MSDGISSCPKCKEYKWFHNPPPRNWKNHVWDEEYCLLHAPAEDKIEVSNFNFQINLYIKQLIEKKQPIELRGTIFPHKIRFSELFQEPLNGTFVDLTNSVFAEDLDCSDFIFENYFNLSFSEFQGEVNFSKAVFKKKIDLIETVFKNSVSFGEAHFQEGVLIFGAQFDKRLHFESATSPALNIIASSIEGNAYFDESKIDKLEFVNSKFYGHISLNSVRAKQMRLAKNMFDGDVEFEGIDVEKDLKFESNLCRGGVYLKNASVSGDVSFKRTKFKDYTAFERSKFMGEMSFEEAYASESVSFGNTQFGKSVDFKVFTVCRTIQLRDIEMENVYLKSAQIEAFRFTNCTWPKQDEHSCVAGHSSSSPEELSDVYRRLKKVAKLDHDELRASEWHWQEKEMTYRSSNTPRFIRIFLWAYRLFSGYGEVPNRALWWLLGLLLLPPIVFGLSTLIQTGMSWTVDWSAVGDVGRDWYNSLPLAKIMAPETHGAGKRLLYLVFQIIITLQASLFAFSLRNKLRR